MQGLIKNLFGLIIFTVLQLCYNKLTGSIPNQFGSLKKLNVLALQYNQLSGAIPASLGDLVHLTRLDLGFNHLFGSIPLKLANPPRLEILDIRNNTLSGNVPLGNWSFLNLYVFIVLLMTLESCWNISLMFFVFFFFTLI